MTYKKTNLSGRSERLQVVQNLASLPFYVKTVCDVQNPACHKSRSERLQVVIHFQFRVEFAL